MLQLSLQKNVFQMTSKANGAISAVDIYGHLAFMAGEDQHQLRALIAENGRKWRRLPKEYGNWHTVYTRPCRWAERGV